MKRMRKIQVFSFGLVVLCVFVYWLSGYRPSEFRGAGPMRDDGFFSYYRYHAPLGNVPFDKEGSHTFQFSGLPSERMVLQFYIPGYPTVTREVLENLSTTLSAEIMDDSGKIVYAAIGNPSGSLPEEKWMLMSSSSFAAYWHKNSPDGVFSRGKEYTLHVTVKNIDPKSPNLTLNAMLEGGGHELP